MNPDEIDRIEKDLKRKISLSSLGEVTHFLGIRIAKDEDGFYCMDQKAYVTKLAKQFGLDQAKVSSIPIDVGYYRSRTGSKQLADNKDYRSIIGALLYVAVNTRPDVAASVAILARQVSEPTEVDWVEVKRVVRYLQKTKDYRLKLVANRDEPLRLVGFCDADWSSDTTDRKSNSGYIFQLGQLADPGCSGACSCRLSRPGAVCLISE
ncbi:uncharacterized protein LOC135714064 [Ochlerotatus camptorhynchus]|uniref:uncharacterized protein LOC135714064 n=1 Tax=Ochlerotatus camptorhynchus TaxID=644619 RepID=UPI0031E48B03